jgi:hypothetical protein
MQFIAEIGCPPLASETGVFTSEQPELDLIEKKPAY